MTLSLHFCWPLSPSPLLLSTSPFFSVLCNTQYCSLLNLIYISLCRIYINPFSNRPGQPIGTHFAGERLAAEKDEEKRHESTCVDRVLVEAGFPP